MGVRLTAILGMPVVLLVLVGGWAIYTARPPDREALDTTSTHYAGYNGQTAVPTAVPHRLWYRPVQSPDGLIRLMGPYASEADCKNDGAARCVEE